MRPFGPIGAIMFAVLHLSQVASAETATPLADVSRSIGASRFCELASQSNGVFQRAHDPSQRMAFQNDGGLFNKGVCWWHSLYQRAAWYLAVFRPELPKPSLSERKFLVHQLARGKEVVEIPGYKDFFEFSADNRQMIQAKLNQWQLSDGVLRFVWIDSLFKPKTLPPVQMSAHMRELTDLVIQSNEIQWVMWQVPGIVAHASLLLGAYPQQTWTDYTNVDSNYPTSTRTMTYNEGANHVMTYFGPIVPHSGRRSDLARFDRAARDYCSYGPRAHSYSDRLRILNEPLYNGLE